MTEMVEGVAVALLGPEQQAQLQACAWKDCKKDHPRAITYPQGGTVERSGSYANTWVGAGLEPWVKYGPGTDSRATLADYRAETPNAAYVAPAAAMTHPQYHTQKHHLISVKLFKEVEKLSHDAKLVAYDVNHPKNGVCLPSFVVDIVRHDLQCHRGNHPNDLYYDKISPLLRNLEQQCAGYCTSDASCDAGPQKRLLDRLRMLSERVEAQLKAWKWLLRSDAARERTESRNMLNQKITQGA